jgi:hypothetical protein
MAIEIVDLPVKHGDLPVRYGTVYQRVNDDRCYTTNRLLYFYQKEAFGSLQPCDMSINVVPLEKLKGRFETYHLL